MNGKLLRVLLIATLALCMAVVAACGGNSDKGSGSKPASGGSSKKVKVGMVTDVGGLNDRGFNASAYQGLKRAQSELGAEIRVITSTSNTDYVPNLSTLARQKFDLVIGVGFLMGDALEKVAKAFPTTKFAIVDYSPKAMKSKPKNVEGLLFKENEGGYLVGYMAGLYVKGKGGNQVVSSVGGQSVPAVDGYIAGYEKGAKDADPGVKALHTYSQDFQHPDKCKELALNQIGEGSRVVFAAAGQCGLGALDAAKEKGARGIGVDKDQGYLGDFMLTSALKKVDEAAFAAAKAVQGGSFKGGGDQVYDAKSGGVGYGKTNAEGAKYKAKVDAVLAKIKSGQITNIPLKPGA